MGDSAPIF